MDHTEVNEKGNFDTWESEKIRELKKGNFDSPAGKCLFENHSLRLLEIKIQPYERLEFTKYHNNYSLTCLSGGLAISRSASGKINLLRFNKDDIIHLQWAEKEVIIDFQNIGEDLLHFVIVEHKPESILSQLSHQSYT